MLLDTHPLPTPAMALLIIGAIAALLLVDARLGDPRQRPSSTEPLTQGAR